MNKILNITGSIKSFLKTRAKILAFIVVVIAVLLTPLPQKSNGGNLSNLPNDFLWGAATSAHQIEGGDIRTDWSEFEKIHGNIKNDDNARAAVDGYDQSISDIKLLKDLGLNSYRFSIEWARVEPEKGKYDQKALDHYRKLIQELKNNGVEPIVTLHHFTTPKWVTDKGGWEKKETIADFNEYVTKIVLENQENVRYWIPVNEPSVIINGGYLVGNFPPNKKNPFLFWKSYNNVIEAHKESYDVIHSLDNDAMVSVAYNVTNFEPKRNSLFDNASSKAANYLFSWLWLDKIKDKMDFVGVNYYKQYHIGFGLPFVNEFFIQTNKTDMNWNIQPEGLDRGVKKVSKRYDKPIMITENGLADRGDSKRGKFIEDHLTALKKASAEGANVIGYMHWSLLDNFEWSEGYDMKFGLYEVDRRTMERKIRPSAIEYKKIIEESNAGKP